MTSMTLPKMNTDIGRVDQPCVAVTDIDSLPKPVVSFMETLDLHDDFEVIRVDGVLTDADVFFIDDPESGDGHMIIMDRGSQQIIHESMLAELPVRKRIDAVRLFVGACSSGMMHFDCWEEHQEYSRLTETEFDALYGGNADVLHDILSELLA